MKSEEGAFAERLLARIVESSICAVKPATVFEKQFYIDGNLLTAFGHVIDLKSDHPVRCVAIGKSAEAMALEVGKRLGDRVCGVIATPIEKHLGVNAFKFFKTGHPFPDAESVNAGKDVRSFVSTSEKDDLLLFLISGGGSASIFVPVEGVTLEDVNEMIKILLDNGIPIDKINLLRRHLSASGGGKLAALANNQLKLSLIISDVVGDDIPSIASGPTCPGKTTPADAHSFLSESGMMTEVPKSISETLERLSRDFVCPTLENNMIEIIASNSKALSAAEKVGIENGFNTVVLTRSFDKEVESAAELFTSIAMSIEQEGALAAQPALILIGGETTVKVRGSGKGGRNQHLVLSALYKLATLAKDHIALNKTTVFSFGTDGVDGNTSDAGAFGSLNLAAAVNGGPEEIEKYLLENDSNSFFKKYGGLITTGPTDTNVMDISGVIVA